MTYPSRIASTLYEGSFASSHDVTLPASISAGDLLMMKLTIAGSATVSTPPSGWTELDVASVSIGLGSFLYVYVYIKRADGSEGSTVNVGLSGAVQQQLNAITTQFASDTWYDSGTLTEAVAAGTEVTYSVAASSYDPPSLDPGWEGADAVTIPVAAFNDGFEVSSYPSGYTDGQSADGFQPTITCAYKETNGAEDPGVFTLGTAEIGLVNTLMVRGAAAAGGGSGLFFGAGF